MSETIPKERPTHGDSSLRGEAMRGLVFSIVERAQAIRVAPYEESERSEVEELRETVVDCLRASLSCLSDVQSHYEKRGATPSGGLTITSHGRQLCESVDRHFSRPASLEKIGDLVFVASLGLRSRLTSVEAVANAEDRWDVIADCSGAVREVLKSFSALESAVCEFEGLTPKSTFFGSELDRALKIRKAYIALRDDVVGAEPPREDEIHTRLRLTATAIAKLASRDEYISARVQDRRMIRDAQRRILEWLRTEPKRMISEDPELSRLSWLRNGARLWQDIANLSDLIMGVNNRAELRQHDAEVLDRAMERLAEKKHAEKILPGVDVPILLDVVGRDAELDSVVLADRAVDPAELERAMSRALLTLRVDGFGARGGGAEGSFAPF